MVTQHFNRIGQLTLVLLAVVALAYCSDSGSPTAPSFPSSGGSRSGATVQGTINAGRQSAALRTAATHAACGPDITVTLLVDGTEQQSTVVDCAAGTFMFTNVPPGSITLNISNGLSIDEDFDLGDLGDGETLEVEVTVDGTSVEVEAEREDSPSEDSVSEDSESEDSESEDSVSEDSVSEDSGLRRLRSGGFLLRRLKRRNDDLSAPLGPSLGAGAAHVD